MTWEESYIQYISNQQSKSQDLLCELEELFTKLSLNEVTKQYLMTLSKKPDDRLHHRDDCLNVIHYNVEESEKEVDNQNSQIDQEWTMTRSRKRLRQELSPQQEQQEQQEEQEDQEVQSNPDVLTQESETNRVQEYSLYLVWSFHDFCKIGITRKDQDSFLDRYRTYLPNFIFWYYPLSQPCVSLVARQYENMLKSQLGMNILNYCIS